jgi:hypothetical protein
LTLPYPLRYRCAYDTKLMSEILNLFLRTLFASLRPRARRQGVLGRLQCGSVSFLQRFGSAINLNCHIHTLALDGVYEVAENGPTRFHPLPPPDDEEVGRVVVRVAHNLAKHLKKHGFGQIGDPSDLDPLAEQHPLLAMLAAASIQGRVATGPRAGQQLLRLGDCLDAEDLDYLEATPPPRCANAAGLNLHADVAVPFRDRKRLERLARYCARPPIATDRLTKLADGRLCYRLKHRWRDGTTHVVLDPIDLLERLATFVPSPRSHTVRYHGILAPCASWRDHVVPQPVAPAKDGAMGMVRPQAHGVDVADASGRAHDRPPVPSSEQGDKQENPVANHRREPLSGVGGESAPGPPSQHPSSAGSRPRRLSWADLLKRVFAADALACPRCGGRLRPLAAIHDPKAVRAILDCLNLPSRAPPLAPARREPAELELYFGELPISND